MQGDQVGLRRWFEKKIWHRCQNTGKISFWVRMLYRKAHYCPEMDDLFCLKEGDDCFCGIMEPPRCEQCEEWDMFDSLPEKDDEEKGADKDSVV